MATRAYENHYIYGCMYAAVEAVAATVAEKPGGEYARFPFKLSTYVGAGVAWWGTLCGTCNGTAMAVALFFSGEERAMITKELFAWYESSELPEFVPGKPKNEVAVEMVKSRSNSVLCHASLNNWTRISGFSENSKECRDR